MAFFRLSQDESLKSRSLLGIFILLTRISAFHFIWSGFIPKSYKNVTCGKWQVCENFDIFLLLSSTWVGADMEDNTESFKWCSRCQHPVPSSLPFLWGSAWLSSLISGFSITLSVFSLANLTKFPPWFIFRIPPLHPSCCRWSGLGQRKGSGEGKSSTMTSLTRCPPWRAQLDLLPDFTCGI